MPKLSGSNFLDKFVSLFEGTEVPELFAMWGGISCISAMLERRVWIDMNIYKIFPNQFIIFVADSGRMRKSTAIKMTRRLLSKTSPGPRLIAQKITPEALIDSLRVIRTDDPKQIMDETCGGLVIADELVSFINRDTYERGLGGLMIELWDCPDKYEYRTRNREPEEINFGHLSLLGGTTVHTLRDAIPIQAMGGFSSRVLFVYVDEAPIPVPRPTRKPHFARTETELVDHLQSISKISGEIRTRKLELENIIIEAETPKLRPKRRRRSSSNVTSRKSRPAPSKPRSDTTRVASGSVPPRHKVLSEALFGSSEIL